MIKSLALGSNYDKGQKVEILEWLGAPNPSNLYNAAREKYCEGTGSWFLHGETYGRWKREADLPVIIYGSPGYGKTVLCSTIIEDIQDHCEKAGPTSTYAYFFFDGRNSQDEFQLHQSCILSLIIQLTSQHPSIPPSLEHLYSRLKAQDARGASKASLRDLESVLQDIINNFKEVFAVVDALDECSKGQDLTKWIRKLRKAKTGRFHFLATSRPVGAAHLKEMDYLCVDMEASMTSSDIEKYVKEEIDADNNLRNIHAKDLIGQIVTHADGMFRLVAFRLERLRACFDLDEMISMIRDADCPRVLMVLQWLAFSLQALTVEEIMEVSTSGFTEYHHYV